MPSTQLTAEGIAVNKKNVASPLTEFRLQGTSRKDKCSTKYEDKGEVIRVRPELLMQ